jgi:hypothetical protein
MQTFDVIADHMTQSGKTMEVAYQFDARSLEHLLVLCKEHGLFGDNLKRVEQHVVGELPDIIPWQ